VSGEARRGQADGLRDTGVTASTSRVYGRSHPQNGGALSDPRRDFIEKRYVELKKAHPGLPILIRECSDVQPKLWARYGECWSPEV
jgi:hypothetical protein